MMTTMRKPHNTVRKTNDQYRNWCEDQNEIIQAGTSMLCRRFRNDWNVTTNMVVPLLRISQKKTMPFSQGKLQMTTK